MARVHMIGIGGVGMSAVGRLLAANGMTVEGCDTRESRITRELRGQGIPVLIGHDPSHVGPADWIIFSTAVSKDHPELQEARRLKKRVLHRAEALSWILGRYHTSVGITGTHGKGTVSSMIVRILDEAGLKPSFAIGAYLLDYGTNARHKGRDFIVAELDESDGSLMNTTPNIVLINNVEADHLNYYRDYEHVVQTMASFLKNNTELQRAVVCGDDKGALKAARMSGVPFETFGFTKGNTWRGECIHTSPEGSGFLLWKGDELIGDFSISVPGRYNCLNAIGAASVTLGMGIRTDLVKKGLAGFSGLENRFSVVEAKGVWLVKDYISHPTGIRRVLEAAREFSPQRLIAVFKPYRYTMINYLKDEYATAFKDADITLITQMWDAGEKPIEGVDSHLIVKGIRRSGGDARFSGELPETLAQLRSLINKGDMVVFLGGPDLFELADQLAQEF